jgi:hypothetical protein
MRLDDLRSDSWHQIVAVIKRGKHPELSDLAAALSRGEPSIPPEAQCYLKGLLDGSIHRRGRKDKWSEPFAYVHLAVQVDSLRRLYESLPPEELGNKSPEEKAFLAAQMRYRTGPGTVRRYYQKGKRQMRLDREKRSAR